MSCSNRKDFTYCAARGKLRIGNTRHFYRIYLWDDKTAMNACRVDFEGNPDGGADGDALACHMPSRIDLTTGEERWLPMLGELHFLAGKWDMEVVAHECLHASINLARATRIDQQRVFEDGGLSAHFRDTEAFASAGGEREELTDEELFCYAHGEMVNAVYRWLWKVNPSDKWERCS